MHAIVQGASGREIGLRPLTKSRRIRYAGGHGLDRLHSTHADRLKTARAHHASDEAVSADTSGPGIRTAEATLSREGPMVDGAIVPVIAIAALATTWLVVLGISSLFGPR
jgi:hypothetical protein